MIELNQEEFMKKKNLLLVVMASFVLLLTGCGSSDEVQTMTCSRTLNQSGMNTSLNYTITHQGGYVKEVKSVETIESEDTDLLESYKSQVENIYSPYDDIDYYDYEVTVDGNKLTSTVDIDYEHIDTDKLIEIDSANSTLIKDGKIAVSDIKSVYEQLGATCE